jgi:hypothetical protein
MHEPAQAVVRGAAAAQASASLFVVERRLPKINEQQLAVLQAALTGAASRFSARGDGVRYLRSIFLAGQDRLLSLFTAENAEAVRALNEASLVPFTSIEPAVDLPNLPPS